MSTAAVAEMLLLTGGGDEGRSRGALKGTIGAYGHLLQSPQKFEVIEVMKETEPRKPGMRKFLATSPLGSQSRSIPSGKASSTRCTISRYEI